MKMVKMHGAMLAALGSVIMTLPAHAQQDCAISYEMVHTLRDPYMGSFNIWDTVFGKNDAIERFRSALKLPGARMLAAGEITPPGADEVQLVLAQTDHRGRILWDRIYSVTGLQSVVKIAEHNDGSAVIAATDMDGKSYIWIGFFDKDGGLISHKTLNSKDGNLYPHDILPLGDSGEYLLAASVETPHGDYFTQTYRIDEDGNILSAKSYRPGLDNKLLALVEQGDDQYIGAGLMKSSDGREQGWLVSIDRQGNIGWQRSYTYGIAGRFTGIAPYDAQNAVLIGDVMEAGAKYRSGWIMMVDAGTGSTLWQRRYRGKNSYSAEGILRSGDKISALFNTAETRDDRQEYARLFTLDSRGQLLGDKGYFNGVGTRASQLVAGHNGTRVIVGDSNVTYGLEKAAAAKDTPDKETPVGQSVQGWMVAGEPAPATPDRCASMNRR